MRTLLFCIATFWTLFIQAHPKVVAKFGSAQCPWSEQLKQEVWSNSTFQALLDEAGIQKEELQADVNETVPVLILFSSGGEEIGRLGYLLVAPEKYIDLLKEMLSIHTLCQALSPLNDQQLLHLYRKAHVLHMTACEEKLLQEGLLKDRGVSFLIEQYAKLIQDHPHKARKIKEEIREKKPQDAQTEWELALISFEARRNHQDSALKTTLPLEKFLREFGSEHPEYQWRCHLILAEFYRDKNQMDKAKTHAKEAMQGAPQELKDMIAAIGEKS